MSYCTEAEVRNASGFSNTVNVTSATVTAKIAFADSTINAAIGAVYQLPLNTTCDLVHFMSVEMSCVMLEIDNYGEESQNVDKGWGKRMDLFLNEKTGMLEKIRLLKLRLFDANGNELTRNTTRQPVGYPNYASSDPTAPNTTAPQLTMDAVY